MIKLLIFNGSLPPGCLQHSLLQKKKLDAATIETDLQKIKNTFFFNKHNRTEDKMSMMQSIIVVNSEVSTIRTLARNFKVSITAPTKQSETSTLQNFTGMLMLRKITNKNLLGEFRDKYRQASGLDVPVRFLESRAVYATFNRENRMCGGFVLGSTGQFRTIEVFASESSKPALYEFAEKTTCCEVNCFWLSVKNRRGFWSYWFWLLFAFKVYRQKEKIIIYGTIARSFANIYGYPKRSRLLHSEELVFDGKLRTSWIFTCARSYFLKGVMEIFVYKFRNSGKRPVSARRLYASLATNE